MRRDLNLRSPLLLCVAILAALIVGSMSLSRMGRGIPRTADALPHTPAPEVLPETWTDQWGDGFPDSARLDRKQDRENFVRWLTFLAESQFYQPSPAAGAEIDDCAALVRFAFRNALVAHNSAWRRSMGLPFDPGFEDIGKFNYPNWPLGVNLFRTQPGPFETSDRESGAFAEFADASNLLHYNTNFISRDIGAARPGDLLFFNQSGQTEPFHTMVFVGKSYFQARGEQWIVYHTGDLNGRRGEIREVDAPLLMRHPDLRWRPSLTNLRFLGVYRFNILR